MTARGASSYAPTMRPLTLLCVGLVLVVASCKKDPPSAHWDATPPPEPPPAAEDPPPPPPTPAPALATLQADIRKLLPELRENIANGRSRKHELTPVCMRDFTPRLSRTHAIARLIGVNDSLTWPDPQRDLADALDNVLIPLRGCINCHEGDEKDCATAEQAMQKLQAELAKKPPPAAK